MKSGFSKLNLVILYMILIESIILLSAGIITDVLWVTILGGVLCGFYVVFAEFYVIKLIRKSIKEKFEKNGNDRKQTEEEMVQDVNSTSGIENYIKLRAHQFANLSNTWKCATVGEKVWNLFLIISFLCCFVTMVVFMLLKNWIICLVAMGLEFILICGSIIFAKLMEKQSLTILENCDAGCVQHGKVLVCYLYTMKTKTKGSMSRVEYESNFNREQNLTTRIADIVYKLQIQLNGKTVIAFSKKPYNQGDRVTVCKTKKNKRIFKLIEEENTAIE